MHQNRKEKKTFLQTTVFSYWQFTAIELVVWIHVMSYYFKFHIEVVRWMNFLMIPQNKNCLSDKEIFLLIQRTIIIIRPVFYLITFYFHFYPHISYVRLTSKQIIDYYTVSIEFCIREILEDAFMASHYFHFRIQSLFLRYSSILFVVSNPTYREQLPLVFQFLLDFENFNTLFLFRQAISLH